MKSCCRMVAIRTAGQGIVFDIGQIPVRTSRRRQSGMPCRREHRARLCRPTTRQPTSPPVRRQPPASGRIDARRACRLSPFAPIRRTDRRWRPVAGCRPPSSQHGLVGIAAISVAAAAAAQGVAGVSAMADARRIAAANDDAVCQGRRRHEGAGEPSRPYSSLSWPSTTTWRPQQKARRSAVAKAAPDDLAELIAAITTTWRSPAPPLAVSWRRCSCPNLVSHHNALGRSGASGVDLGDGVRRNAASSSWSAHLMDR